MLFKSVLFSKFSKFNNLETTANIATFVKSGGKILGTTLNYKDLLIKKNLPKPENPTFFTKPTSSYIEVGQSIIIPKGFCVNEEIELGVVIGKEGKHIPKQKAMDFVNGYCAALDLTAFNEINKAKLSGQPWSIGKGFDTACPVSRFIEKSEICNINDVTLWAKVNGELRQKGNTNDLVFSIPCLISYISKFMTLYPGDVILTGTPSGMSPIQPGDLVEGGIEGVLTIRFNVCEDSECPA